MISVLTTILAYFLGAIPWGYLLVRWKTGEDIRAKGSGNIGAANVARQSSPLLGILVLLLDAAKGFAAAWIAWRFSEGSMAWTSLAALAAMAGHVFPVFLGFRGGKAVATFFGAFAWVTPLPAAAVGIIWILGTAVTRHTSVGSGLAALTFPFAVWLILHPPRVLVLVSIAAAVLILWRHRENFQRIHQDTEARLRLGKR